MKDTLGYLLLSVIFSCTTACAQPSKEGVQICNFHFDPDTAGFNLRSYDETSCSAFVAIIGRENETEEGGSIIVFNRPPKEALPSVPSNFFMNAAGTISHRNPEPVSDDKNFYYVDDIEPLGNEKLSSQDHSSIEVFKYQRTITRIDQNGEESSNTQTCVDVMRYSNRTTALFTGCVDQSEGSSLHDRAVDLMRTASVRN